MSPEPITAERTYQKLKHDIVSGRHRPGSVLNLQRLADEFGSSVTPLRDAIHRLVGERLIEVHQGGGFELPVPTAEWLRNLYSWHDQLIRQAIRNALVLDSLRRSAEHALFSDVPEQHARDTADFFAALAASSRNPEFEAAVASASDRLFLARVNEPALIKRTADELKSLTAMAISGPAAAVRAAVRDYHRRRLRRVDRLVASLLS